MFSKRRICESKNLTQREMSAKSTAYGDGTGGAVLVWKHIERESRAQSVVIQNCTFRNNRADRVCAPDTQINLSCRI